MTAVAIDRVSVSLGGSRVVEGVSATVEPGEWLTLIGPNGAGKSTLLRAVARLVEFEGSIRLDGTEVTALRRRDLARRIAFVPQSPVLPPEMHVRDYVLLGRTPYVGTFSTESRADHEAADRAIARLELGAFATRPLGTLSGGEQQRAVLARAIAQEAPVLLLDEPTTALDIGRQQQALELVAELRAQRALTVLSAMHELTLASQYADRLALLSAGRLVAIGAPGEIATRELISEHYNARVEVVSDDSGPIAVIPVRRRS
ncbi:MAG TPA: ABC transporter ATP-binding protein [Gaiellaceae bacterium]|jgi:iron complex transport system ATP-binding protein|nr:ABC transporter ATP-binding protein [Gaiellaceae bacterium]